MLKTSTHSTVGCMTWPVVACLDGAILQRFAVALSVKTNQINWSEVYLWTRELFLPLVAACDMTPVLLPRAIIQWIEVGWIGGHSSLAMKLRQFDMVKHETWNGKNDSARIKINANLLNIKTNQSNLVNMCWYNLTKFHGNTA